jgi:DNA-binding transcriptional regulator YiaG
MNVLPPQLQKRREVEDRAIALGTQRHELNQGVEANTHAIIDLLRDTDGTGISFDQLAALLNVSRQSLYNWREIGAQIQPGESATEYAAKRD